jgi:hypothetical protein
VIIDGWKRLDVSNRIYMGGLRSNGHRRSTGNQAHALLVESLSRSVHPAILAKRQLTCQPGNNHRSKITDGVSPRASRLSTIEFELATMGAVLG